MKGEIWKDIEGYEGLYQVSNMGRVRSVERTVWNGKGYFKTPERIRKASANGYGYLEVVLFKDGKRKAYSVHRLVASAFLDNSEGYKEINHKDEDKTNNCVENLEYCSRSYNNTYNGRAKKAGKKAAEKRCKPVFSVNKESGLIMWWQSAKDAERYTGIASSHITECCKGRLKSTGGHIWFYADDDAN